MLDDESVASLSIRLKGKDPEAWREFDAVYRPIVMAYLRVRGLKESDASDVYQDICVNLIKGIQSYDSSKVRFHQWLFTVVQRTLIDKARRRTTARRAEVGWAGEVLRATTSDEAKMEEEWIRTHRTHILEQAIRDVKARTPSRTWSCFEQRLLKNRPAAEIASELGLTTRAVQIASLRVLKQLRDVCQELDQDIREITSFPIEEKPAPSGVESITPPEDESSALIRPSRSRRPPLVEQGETVFGKYRLIEKIGEGGMGEVWAADNIKLHRRVALKLIKPEIAGNDRGWKRFQREARLMAELGNPNLVTIYDFRRTAGMGYIETEFVAGQTLDKYIEEHGNQPLTPEATAAILDQLCAVLQTAHGHVEKKTGEHRPIIHRGLKPSNLMLVEGMPEGQNLRVLDFGFARMLEGELGTTRTFSATAVLPGSAPYMSPEQIQGGWGADAQNEIDYRSDLYSVGVILYELLTGTVPFRGDRSTGVLRAHLTEAPRPMKEANPAVSIPPDVERVVMRCLEKDPLMRPSSAQELAGLFHQAIEEMEVARARPQEAMPTSRVESPAGFTGIVDRFMGLLRRLRLSFERRSLEAASTAQRESGTRPRIKADQVEAEAAYSGIRKLARVSFPTQVVVGLSYTLSVRLVSGERASREERNRARFGPHLGDWTSNFFVCFMSSMSLPAVRPPAIKVSLTVAAENFEIEGTGRSEIVVPLDGDSAPVQFSLRGLRVGPGRVMLDFSQRGQPTGSIDLTPDVVDHADANLTSGLLPQVAGTLFLNLVTARIPSAPDLVIKVFEHRFAGQAGQLRYVVSSPLDELGDLPVLDGDFGTIELKSDVATWVEDRLGALAALAQQADASPQMVSGTLARVGYSLFEQLLPRDLQELYWSIRGRNVKTILVLSDEPHIPWELIKPYRTDPASGSFEEAGFWGQTYALTHWLRGRPPAQRFSFNRICALAPRARQAPGGESRTTRDMVSIVPLITPQAVEAGDSPACTLRSADEELAILRSLAVSESQFRLLPALCADVLKAFEAGEFDLLHLVAHGEFAGSSVADASSVLMEDGAFRAAELSPSMAAGLRRASPLIFFNSCHSGRLGFSLTRLGSWGARLVQLGCGGFVGALWPVTDRAALAFATAFYSEMTEGRPIGEAMLRARLRVRDRYPDDPTWLAYCCFADPLASIHIQATRRA